MHTEALTWAICKANGGGGKGKCDPEHCCCAGEARAILANLAAQDYHLIKIVKRDRPPFVFDD